MNREIAIVVGKYLYMVDEAAMIASSITDWYTVTEDEYAILYSYINHLNKSKRPYSYVTEDHYHIITRAPNSEVPLLISECLKKAKEHEDERKNQVKERERKKKERDHNKLIKQREKELQLLEQLQKKYKE